MADTMKMVNGKRMEDELWNICNEKKKLLQMAAARYVDGVRDGVRRIESDCEDLINEMREEEMGMMERENAPSIKTIGVAEWEKDEDGVMHCSHCGGEAWARKYNEKGEAAQMPSQHCPWCGYEMICFAF